MKYVVWGAPGAGKTSIAEHIGLPDRFHGDESLAHMVLESQVGARQAGITQVVVAVNKMDLAGYEYEAFKAARPVFLRGWHGAPPAFVPVSARFGDLLRNLGNRIDWYTGATLDELLGIAEKAAA